MLPFVSSIERANSAISGRWHCGSGWPLRIKSAGNDDFGEFRQWLALWPMRHTARHNAVRVKKQLIGKQR
jgi:hypothetical protein